MTNLLMIPGPIEVSDAVIEAYSVRPPSHVSPDTIESFGRSLERMRQVWMSDAASQPFIVPGSGTLAMELGAHNLVEPGDRALVVNTGYFGDRMAEMLRRRGAEVVEVKAPIGQAPSLDEVTTALDGGDYRALFATHVDTSTGVRVDAAALARAARERDVLSCFDGVCATAGERFEMEAWGADVYLTGSQKAVGLPAGIAMLVASARAMQRREAMKHAPPMSLDLLQWLPIMRAYEARKPSYFATPATTLLPALETSLGEILADEVGGAKGIEARFQRHQKVADGMRAAWAKLGLTLLPEPQLAANTLSAIRYPDGVDASLVGAVKARGVVIAGGLHPAVKQTYFRVGHMGEATRRREWLVATVEAVGGALGDVGHQGADVAGAKAALEEHIGGL